MSELIYFSRLLGEEVEWAELAGYLGRGESEVRRRAELGTLILSAD